METMKEIARRDCESDPHFQALKYVDGLITSFKHSPYPSCLVDRDGYFVDVNQAWCELVGRTSDELKHLRWQDITHPDDIGEDQRNAQAILNDEISSYVMEKRYVHADGHVFRVRLKVVGARRDAVFSIFASYAEQI